MAAAAAAAAWRWQTRSRRVVSRGGVGRGWSWSDAVVRGAQSLPAISFEGVSRCGLANAYLWPVEAPRGSWMMIDAPNFCRRVLPILCDFLVNFLLGLTGTWFY